MTHLRQILLEELRRRNYGAATTPTPPSTFNIHTVEHFSRHFHRSPDQLGPEHIRQYQAALFTRWKLAPNTVIQRLAALRFFYVQVLKRGWSVAETPYPKKVLHLPEILSQEEVARLIDAAEFPFHRILLMTLYATGARRAEVAHLKISDIDKQRMVIHIRRGKGGKDRDVMLSPKLLDALRIWLVAYNAEVLAANSGIRGGEIKQLQLGDINLEARRLRIRRKGTKTDAGARLVELNHSALEALTKLYMRAQTLGAADPNHYLLPADLSRHTKSSDPPRGQLGFDATKHRNSWHSAWRSLLTAAGLEGSDSTICAIHLLRLWPSGAYRCRSCKAWLVT